MHGLVLEGGGAKGAYQVGAIKALVEMGYEFSAIAGTSIGAINGAFIANGKLDFIYSIWEEGEINRVIETDKEVLQKILDFDFKGENIFRIFEYIMKIINNGGLDISPLRKLLEENIDEASIRKSSVDFGLVTVSFTDFQPLEVFIEEIPEGKLIDYLIASASLPIFKLKKIDGKSYLDGGFYNNIPITLMTKKNIKDIIVIETEGIGRKRKVKEEDLNIIRIRPSKKIARTIEVDPKIMKRNVKLGYLDARRVIQGLKSQKYCIEHELDELFFLKEVKNLNKIELERIFELFNFTGTINYKNLYEVIFPILAKILALEEDSSYMDLFIRLNEEVADCLKIDKLKAYTFQELNDLIKQKMDFDEEIIFSSKYQYIPFKHLPKQIEVLPKEIKESVLKEFFRIYYS
jgi:NTE family protein